MTYVLVYNRISYLFRTMHIPRYASSLILEIIPGILILKSGALIHQIVHLYSKTSTSFLCLLDRASSW